MTANLQQPLDNQTPEVIVVKQQPVKKSKMLRLFGFETSDFHTWHNFVRLMNRPEDPSSLAFFRILFGILMMIDIPNERGMSDTDLVYGDKSQCRFPLFSFIRPLDTSYMVIIYAVMFLAALGITLGLRYRISCFIFLTIYWYIFFLDKTTWNNHSYLYGLIGTLLFITDGNRYMSVDGLVNKSIRNTHVPLWNYTLLRSQVFFVYFIAGLKKIDFDWISGYSMIDLASHWVFDPFKMFLTHDQITVFIVHHGGLFIDLFVGYMLFFDKTRLVGTVISSSFHIMNSRMFNIGMFPYAMLATTCIFYSNDWPKRFFLTARLLRERLDPVTNKFYVSGLSAHCVYDKLKDPTTEKNIKKNKGHSFYQNFFAIFTIIYLSEQVFLPYSHFITKGYNNWTNGLYGYSWDMMVHSWHTQHIKISFLDKTTNRTHYINPRAWSTRKRWSSHGDMIHQYSECIKERLHAMNYTDIELYIDVWRSMNHRFNQRQIDPRVDMVKAKWSHFEATKWLMPLLTELSNWRVKMAEIERKLLNESQEFDLTFVADFNGLKLENFISQSLNASIEVLQGEVNVEFEEAIKDWNVSRIEDTNEGYSTYYRSKKVNKTLKSGEKLHVPSNAYHNVYTISKEPSCFFYVYVNQTAISVTRLYEKFSKNMMTEFEIKYAGLNNGKQFNESYDEMKSWKAYNKTVVACSKNFFKFLELRNTTLNGLIDKKINIINNNIDIENEELLVGSLLKAGRINEIYELFVDKFYSQIQVKLETHGHGVVKKLMKKLRNNVLKFKQRYQFMLMNSIIILSLLFLCAV